MKDHRHGEQLWVEWAGDGLETVSDIQYYTEGHIELSEDVVRRALASSLQRDGVADSLADGFGLMERGEIQFLWAGCLNEELHLTVCDETGETHYGDEMETYFPITVVHILL